MELLFLVYLAIGFVIVVAIDSQGGKQKGEQESFFRLFLPALLWPMFVLAGLGMWLGDRFLSKKKPSESLSASNLKPEEEWPQWPPRHNQLGNPNTEGDLR